MYDLIIIGGGVAGFSAGLYAARARLDTVLIEKLGPGGQIATTDLVENYPGIIEINGYELSIRMEEQAKKHGLKVIIDEVISASLKGEIKEITLSNGKKLKSYSVIISTGANYKKLGVPGEDKFLGRGVSFCATCDGAFFKGKDIVVVGGGNSALDEGLFLTRFVNSITLIHRRDTLRAEKVLQERVLNNPKFKFVWNSVVEEILGDEKVEAVRIRNVVDNKESILKTDGVFIFIGLYPNTSIFDEVEKNENGYIKVNLYDMSTNIPGVFAAGDCVDKFLRQAITAAGEGATAAVAAEKYIEKIKVKSH
ncbi:MAG: thioredoxin-disulfide reductase [Spirochaetia bacterium]|nr:thioredoxin-disulfide reductase [Spirochaetota bacterium]MCX8096403.1 thioredoxin-disulfide reductase [Spirochaetota bacterium]MDW8112710.1 thioredoxin-disulfide reductase [Spirochaetia bacterium]